MNYCSQCGKTVAHKIPDGDNRPRYVCDHCTTIHYQNPRVIAGCLPYWQDQILLCKRAIEPRYGLWTLPAGFMENGETSHHAAQRETWEEAQAKVEIEGLYGLINLPHINQIYIMYRAKLTEAQFSAGIESLEVRLFNEHEIPWEQLAFPVMHHTLENYLRDRKTGEFPIHTLDLNRKIKK